MKSESQNAKSEIPGAQPKRRLAIALDGVPWQAIDEHRQRGGFSIFQAPSRVISPFPTMTNIGMNAMMGAKKSLGYENLYFDREEGRMRGGAMKYIQKRKEDHQERGYNCLLDYEEPMQYEFLVYVFPERIFTSDLALLIDKFRRSSAPAFYAFLKSTDGIIHLGGREKLMRLLRELDSALSQLHEDYWGELEIQVFSDHGNTLRPFKRVSMKTHLARYGFDLTNRVKTARSAIIPGFGLCSYAPVYTNPKNRREIADSLATLEGVDFSVFLPSDDAFKNGNPERTTELIGPRGHARIHRDTESNRFRYEQLAGDPLQLDQVIAKLEVDRLIDSRGFADDSIWFEATKDHRYPDALRNIWSSVRDHVESIADVMVSFEDGFCYGSAVFDRIVNMAATHGSALRSTSYAFLMSTHRQTAAHMRAHEAAKVLRPL